MKDVAGLHGDEAYENSIAAYTSINANAWALTPNWLFAYGAAKHDHFGVAYRLCTVSLCCNFPCPGA